MASSAIGSLPASLFCSRAVPHAVSAIGGPCEYQYFDDRWAGADRSAYRCFGVCTAANYDAMAESGGISLLESAESGWDGDWPVRQCSSGRGGWTRHGKLFTFADEEPDSARAIEAATRALRPRMCSTIATTNRRICNWIHRGLGRLLRCRRRRVRGRAVWS